MEKIIGYHITKKENLASIRKYGLVPNYGENSSQCGDNTYGVFFTTKEYVETWKKIFHKESDDEIIVLSFMCENEGNRIHESNDYYMRSIIPNVDINVALSDDETVSLLDYYSENKEELDHLLFIKITQLIKKALEKIEKVSNKEDVYTEEDFIEILDLISKLKAFDDKLPFDKEINIIKKFTIKFILENGMKKESEEFKKTCFLFDNLDDVSIEEINKLKLDMANGLNFESKYVNNVSDILMNKMSENKKSNLKI